MLEMSEPYGICQGGLQAWSGTGLSLSEKLYVLQLSELRRWGCPNWNSDGCIINADPEHRVTRFDVFPDGFWIHFEGIDCSLLCPILLSLNFFIYFTFLPQFPPPPLLLSPYPNSPLSPSVYFSSVFIHKGQTSHGH